MAADDTAGLGAAEVVGRADRDAGGGDYTTPLQVTGAITAGVAPLPFLGVYALIFIVHGTIHPVSPPDITSTQGGEFTAGLVALLLLVVFSLGIFWLLHATRRWAFVLSQLATLGTCCWLMADRTTGPIVIPIILALTSVTAVAFALHPVTARFISGAQVRAS